MLAKKLDTETEKIAADLTVQISELRSDILKNKAKLNALILTS